VGPVKDVGRVGRHYRVRTLGDLQGALLLSSGLLAGPPGLHSSLAALGWMVRSSGTLDNPFLPVRLIRLENTCEHLTVRINESQFIQYNGLFSNTWTS